MGVNSEEEKINRSKIEMQDNREKCQIYQMDEIMLFYEYFGKLIIKNGTFF